jgi:hypothetical protein
MGLLDKLTQQGSNLTGLNGATPSNMPGANDLNLDYTMSILLIRIQI